MQNSVICTSNTSLYGSQPSSVVFATKTATCGPELQVSTGPRLHLSFCTCNTAWLALEILVLWLPVLICGFCMQNSDFWSRITSLYGSQTSPVILCMQNSVICNRMTTLNGFQPSFVVLCKPNSDFWSRITSLYGSQISPIVLCLQNSVISITITSLYGSQPSSVVFGCKKATVGPE